MFYCKTKTGCNPPKYVHNDINLAITEAKRLHEKYNTEVEILEVVGVVKTIQVPVVRDETKVELVERYNKEDLPF